MKEYNVDDGKLRKEIITACCDEYDFRLSAGLSSCDAYNAAVADVDGILRLKSRGKANKFRFIFIVSVCAFAVSLFEILLQWLAMHEEATYAVELMMAFIALTALIVYAAVKHKKMHWFDYVILIVLWLAWTASFLQTAWYVYGWNELIDRQYMSFEFPCFFTLKKYVYEEPWRDTLLSVSTTYIYCFELIASFIALAATSVFYIRENLKRKSE